MGFPFEHRKAGSRKRMQHQHNCSVCGKPATYHFTKIVNGQMQEKHLCDEHAAESGSYLAKSNVQITLEQLLTSLFQQAQQAGAATEAENEPDMRCGVCHLPFSAYRKTMILGCDRCYESFEDRLRNDLRKFHGAIKHRGRRPPNFKPRKDVAHAMPVLMESEAAAHIPPKPKSGSKKGSSPIALDTLKEQMKRAVESEDFEEAARLRDQIRKFENKIENAE
jgi:protein arginine kinase activator